MDCPLQYTGENTGTYFKSLWTVPYSIQGKKHWYILLNLYGLSPTVYRGKTLVHTFKSLWTVPYSIQGGKHWYIPLNLWTGPSSTWEENTGTYL